MSKNAIVKKGKGTNPRLPTLKSDEEKLVNSERIDFIMQIAEIGRNTPRDPEAMYNSFIQYLKLCRDNGQIVGNMQAYMAMGLSRQEVYQIKNGIQRRDDPRYRELVSYVQSVCTANRENLIAEGKLNPITGIFWQRNFDGLSNFERKDDGFTDPLGDKRSPYEIAKLYADIDED